MNGSTLPAGTAGLNVPMFIALRRFTLLFTILLERFWLKKSHDWPTLSAMGIMIGGAPRLSGPPATQQQGVGRQRSNTALTALPLQRQWSTAQQALPLLTPHPAAAPRQVH